MTTSARWRDLRVRVVSAAIMLPLGLACIWAGGSVWAASVAAISAGLGAEFAVLSGLSLRTPAGAALPVCVLAVSATAFWHPADAPGVLLAASACAGLMARRPDAGLGALWIGAACVSLVALRRDPDGLGDVLFVMAVVWCGDIGAYVAGRLLGGKRLAPSLSPGKTWSGSAGGLACSVAAGLGVCLLARSGGLPGRAAVFACLLGVVAQAGDLLESAVKRRYGRKDSGWIIPGHGGLLDRLDGVLAAAPAALALCFATAQEGLGLWA